MSTLKQTGLTKFATVTGKDHKLVRRIMNLRVDLFKKNYSFTRFIKKKLWSQWLQKYYSDLVKRCTDTHFNLSPVRFRFYGNRKTQN